MSYELTSRTIALATPKPWPHFSLRFSPNTAKPLQDGAESITTIGGHWDDSDKTRIRAASCTKARSRGNR
jgi:hypothetical protein